MSEAERREIMIAFSRQLWERLRDKINGHIQVRAIGESLLIVIKNKEVEYEYILEGVFVSIVYNNPLDKYADTIIKDYRKTIERVFFKKEKKHAGV